MKEIIKDRGKINNVKNKKQQRKSTKPNAGYFKRWTQLTNIQLY